MSLALSLVVGINVLVILMFSFGLYFCFKESVNPKHKANCGFIMAMVMLLYMILMAGFVGLSVLHGNYWALLLLTFVLIPFVIGNYVRYVTVKKYSLVQIGCFVFSLICLIVFFA